MQYGIRFTKKQKASNKQKKQPDAVFHPEFREDLKYWVRTDRKIALKTLELVEAIMREPFEGIGKPESLKYLTPAYGLEN